MASNLKSSDYYEILGCPRNADDAALKKAYRKLAVKWHPDKNPDNPQAKDNFQRISEAYATLSDPNKRKIYDVAGPQGVQAADSSPSGGPGMGPHGPSPFGHGPPGGTFHFSTFPDGRPGMQRAPSMSSREAEAFFQQFFGHSDPFGASFGHNPKARASAGPMGFGNLGPPGMGMDPFMTSSMPMPGMHTTGGIPSQRAHTPPHRKRFDAIPTGTVVSLKGLVNSPDRNGDRGEVLEYDPVSQRYTILLEDSDEQLKVKPHNLLQHVHIKIQGLESSPELNGLRGTIIAWNDLKQRYSVYVMDRSKVVGLKPSNVILEPGTVGMIMGLNSKPELNGRYGKIKTWLRDANRYEVQLSKDQIIRVKVENVRV